MKFNFFRSTTSTNAELPENGVDLCIEEPITAAVIDARNSELEEQLRQMKKKNEELLSKLKLLIEKDAEKTKVIDQLTSENQRKDKTIAELSGKIEDQKQQMHELVDQLHRFERIPSLHSPLTKENGEVRTIAIIYFLCLDAV